MVQVEMYEGIPGSEDEPVWQGVYTLRIVNDEITSGIVVISEEEFSLGIGSVTLTIEEEMDNPFDVSFTGLPESVKEEEDVTVMAVGTYGDEATFRWFVNGRSRGINANEYIFSSNSAGLYNISLLVSDGEVVGGHRQPVEVLQATTEVAADLASLEIGYAGEDTSANVTENVILPVTGLNGTHITWNSSDESLVNCSGLVTRPAHSAGDAAVQLTATVTRGTVAETKSFTLTVAKLPQTDAEAVAADKELLEVGFAGLDNADNVTQNVNLPSSGTNGTTITWSSGAVETISTSGVVNRPDYTGESDVTVVLTATISRGGISETKTFSLTVKIILQEQTVTFVSNGGSLVDPQTVYWGYTVGEPTAPTRVGFSFEGWFTDSELTDQWDFIHDYVDGDITLNAKWGDGYRISFNSQGGLNPSPTYITVGYGLAYGELANTAKVGHTFQGWHVDPEGEGGEVTPDTIVAINADHILYAVWQPNTQTITFDAQGGLYDGSDTMIVTYGQMYGELPIATRESYNFSGWWTGLDGTGSLVTESTVFTGTIDRTLYAKWTFDVIVGPAGGLVFYDNPNYEIDGWRYLEAAPYGWYDKETHSAGTYIGDDDPYIQWGAQGYTVDPPATATGIGTGAKNTANIISYHDTLWTLYPEKGDYYANPKDYYEGNDGTVAAKICDEFSIENEGVIYDDWFLPSKDELNFMYQNLQMQSKGGFSWNYYWSSSESNDEFAWIHEFQNGGQYDYAFGGRANAYKVRPVRVF
ncbi:MAG: hypothetical protein CVV48_08770 [Spirochaetae bacterium HGW-Spirochaetae-4]|nr:MAG: hypothetical protein CVV48_08770 [Spirochaetae bacterium HGW-Spirochaetae-4]